MLVEGSSCPLPKPQKPVKTAQTTSVGADLPELRSGLGDGPGPPTTAGPGTTVLLWLVRDQGRGGGLL